MRYYLKYLVIFFISTLALFSITNAQQLKINPGKDAEVLSSSPNINYGLSDKLIIENNGSNGAAVSLMYFNLTSIPNNAVIKSADLYLYCTEKSNGFVLRIARLAPNPSWTETGVKWDNRPYYITPPDTKYFNISTKGYSPYNVKEFVQDWVSGKYSNNGFQLLTQTNGGLASFYSKDANSYQPYLLVSYTTPKGSLQITVQNWNGSSTPLPGANAVVQLYNQKGTLVDSQPTNKKGVALFSNVDAGSGYYYKVYHNPDNPPTIFRQEYWGRKNDISIVDGQITHDTFKRNMPFTSEVHIYNNDTNQEIKNGTSVDIGTKLKIVVKVKNPDNNGSSNQNVKERLVIDGDQLPSYDFDQISSGQSITKGNTTNYTFYFTPSQTGPYYYVVGTLTNVNGTYTYTDGWAWNNSSYFSVNPIYKNILTLEPPFSGAFYKHTSQEIKGLGIRHILHYPTVETPESGKIQHVNFVMVKLVGGTNSYEDDEIVIPFTVNKSGNYKITFKGNIDGSAKVLRAAILGHVINDLLIYGRIVTVGGSSIGESGETLLDTSNQPIPSGWQTVLPLMESLFERLVAIWSGADTLPPVEVFLDGHEADEINNLIKENAPTSLTIPNTKSTFNSNGLSIYTALNKNQEYEFVFGVQSNNIAGADGGVLASALAVSAQLSEINFQLSGSQNMTVPDKPYLISPSDKSNDINLSPTLSWTVSNGSTSYHLQVSKNTDLSSPIIDQEGIDSTSEHLKGLRNNTTYYWRVSASNASGTSPFSDTWKFTTIKPPSEPSLVLPSNNAINQSTSVDFKWNSVPKASTYQVQISKNQEFTSIIADKKSIIDTVYKINNLNKGSTYYWRVDASNSAGASSYSNTREFTTKSALITPTSPASPSLISPINGASNITINPILKWNKSNTASSYHLQLATDQNFSKIVIDKNNLTDTLLTVSNLLNDTRYYWRVAAISSAGSSSYSGSWDFNTANSGGQASEINVASSGNGATASAISVGTYMNKTHYASLAIDGDTTTFWADNSYIPAWLKIKFKKKYSVNKIEIWISGHQQTFSISLSLDGINWTTAVPPTLSKNKEGSETLEEFQIPNIDAQYLKVNITTTSAPAGDIFQAMIAEVKAFASTPTAIRQNQNEIPSNFALKQNYPNPFNPTTIIRYDLPSSQHVTLEVYNILGQLVSTLVNKTQAAGTYNVSFNADHLNSGLYIYRLKAGNFFRTKKMLLIK